MQTVVIPRAGWRAALDEFSTIHQGWRISLELLDPGLGAQPEIDDLPLRGVTAEVNADEPAITIAAGMKSDQITHVIHTPTRVQLEKNDAGADMATHVLPHTRSLAMRLGRAAGAARAKAGAAPRATAPEPSLARKRRRVCSGKRPPEVPGKGYLGCGLMSTPTTSKPARW
jgi:hypothetical protein